jgi:hypothetical protein
MLPEQLKYFYEVLGVKNPPLTREQVAWKVALFCGDGKLNVAENLYVRFARGRTTWCYRYLRNGHDCVMTLGGYTDEREGRGNITLTGALAKADQLDLIRRTCPDSDLLDLRREAQRELAGNSLSLEQKEFRANLQLSGLLPLVDDSEDDRREQIRQQAEDAFRAEARHAQEVDDSFPGVAAEDIEGSITTCEQEDFAQTFTTGEAAPDEDE